MADNSFDPECEGCPRIEQENLVAPPITSECPLSHIEKCLNSTAYPVADCNHCPTLNTFLRHLVVEERTIIQDHKRMLVIEEVASHIRDILKAVLKVRKDLLSKDKPAEERSRKETKLLAALDLVIASLLSDAENEIVDEEEVECAEKVITAMFK